jgi:two-component sensor histidine kinase
MLDSSDTKSRARLELVPPPETAAFAVDVAAEANHRIANNLAMIAALARMRAAGLRDSPHPLSGDDVRLILEEFSARLDTVGQLHRLLAGGHAEATVEVGDYLRDIAERVVSSLSFDAETELAFEADPGCRVRSDRALSLGLIVCELVTNAVKYAHPAGVAGRIEIACRRGPDGTVILAVSDDGVGLPEGVDTKGNGQMGFRLVRSLAEHLGATITFDSGALGLCVTLQMRPPR